MERLSSTNPRPVAAWNDGFAPRTCDSPNDRVAVASQDIRRRVREVAEGALAEQRFGRPVDVLLGLGQRKSAFRPIT